MEGASFDESFRFAGDFMRRCSPHPSSDSTSAPAPFVVPAVRQNGGVVAGKELEDLRRRAEEPVTAEDAGEINARIVALAPADTAALNRLGRAYQFLGYDEKAIKAFENVLVTAAPGAAAANI